MVLACHCYVCMGSHWTLMTHWTVEAMMQSLHFVRAIILSWINPSEIPNDTCPVVLSFHGWNCPVPCSFMTPTMISIFLSWEDPGSISKKAVECGKWEQEMLKTAVTKGTMTCHSNDREKPLWLPVTQGSSCSRMDFFSVAISWAPHCSERNYWAMWIRPVICWFSEITITHILSVTVSNHIEDVQQLHSVPVLCYNAGDYRNLLPQPADPFSADTSSGNNGLIAQAAC